MNILKGALCRASDGSLEFGSPFRHRRPPKCRLVGSLTAVESERRPPGTDSWTSAAKTEGDTVISMVSVVDIPFP